MRLLRVISGGVRSAHTGTEQRCHGGFLNPVRVWKGKTPLRRWRTLAGGVGGGRAGRFLVQGEPRAVGAARAVALSRVGLEGARGAAHAVAAPRGPHHGAGFPGFALPADEEAAHVGKRAGRAGGADACHARRPGTALLAARKRGRRLGAVSARPAGGRVGIQGIGCEAGASRAAGLAGGLADIVLVRAGKAGWATVLAGAGGTKLADAAGGLLKICKGSHSAGLAPVGLVEDAAWEAPAGGGVATDAGRAGAVGHGTEAAVRGRHGGGRAGVAASGVYATLGRELAYHRSQRERERGAITAHAVHHAHFGAAGWRNPPPLAHEGGMD